MIKVQKLSGEVIYLNPDYIEWVEATPDTIVKIHDGTTFSIEEPVEQVVALICDWQMGRRSSGGCNLA